MKRICSLFLIAVLLLFGQLAVFAAPETMAADASGNSSGLIVITKPQNQKDSTFNGAYIISGYGKEGTVVTLYQYDFDAADFKKVYSEMRYIDENGGSQILKTPSEVTIGTSGLFMNSISLKQGENLILVRAENGDEVQMMLLTVTKYNYNIIDLIKSLTD